MAISRVYNRINWQNDPIHDTPLNADNLNSMDSALYTIDGEVVSLDADKIGASDIANVIVGQPTIDHTTGVITFNTYNGGTVQIDTMLEKW